MKCQSCKKTKDLMKSATDKKSGRISYICRECNTKRAKKYRATATGKKNIFKASYRSIDKYRFKHNARMKLYYAVKTGKLCKPKKCEKCLRKKELFAHHEDHTKPLDVDWLCRNCHMLIHKNK